MTHDRYFLDNLTEWTLELDRGQGVPYKGNYSSWLEQKAKRLEVEKGQEEGQAAHAQARAGMDPVARPRRGRPSPRRASHAYDKLAEEAGREETGKAQIQIPPGPRLGGMVVEVEGLSKAFGDRLLIDDLSFKLPPGGIVGVIGPNGAGKTTLFKMITGQEKPDGGVDQARRQREARLRRPEPRPPQRQEDGVGGDLRRPRHHEARRQDGDAEPRLRAAGSTSRAPDQQKKVGLLSGGERNRVHLAKMLKEGGNLLLLDEPTNDLDTETLSALEAALEDFAGCAVVISHDRFFLDRMATHILAFEGDSHVEWFEGNFEDYEEDKKRRLGDAAVEPHRIKFKRFERR